MAVDGLAAKAAAPEGEAALEAAEQRARLLEAAAVALTHLGEEGGYIYTHIYTYVCMYLYICM